MKRMVIATALVVAAGSAGSGYALGAYATGGQQADDASGWHTEESAGEERLASGDPASPRPAPAAIADAASPEHYVCRGCGPTLAQRREQAALTLPPLPSPLSSDAGFGDAPTMSDALNPYH